MQLTHILEDVQAPQGVQMSENYVHKNAGIKEGEGHLCLIEGVVLVSESSYSVAQRFIDTANVWTGLCLIHHLTKSASRPYRQCLVLGS